MVTGNEIRAITRIRSANARLVAQAARLAAMRDADPQRDMDQLILNVMRQNAAALKTICALSGHCDADSGEKNIERPPGVQRWGSAPDPGIFVTKMMGQEQNTPRGTGENAEDRPR